MKLVMKDLLAIVDKESNGVSLGVDAISNLAKHFEGSVKDKSRAEEEKQKKIAQVEGEVGELDRKRNQLEANLAQSNSSIDQQNSKLSDVKRTQNSTKEELADASEELSNLEKSTTEKKRTADKLTSDLQSMKKRHESDIQSLRKSSEDASSKLAQKEAHHKALRLLIGEKAVSFPELKTIRALHDQPNTNLDHLQRITESRRNEVEDTIRALAKRGVVQYDSKSGDVRVLRDMEV